MRRRKCDECGFTGTNVYPLNRVGDDGAVKNLCGCRDDCDARKNVAK